MHDSRELLCPFREFCPQPHVTDKCMLYLHERGNVQSRTELLFFTGMSEMVTCTSEFSDCTKITQNCKMEFQNRMPVLNF
ncbi:hypothetical protein EVAR_58960_1 [Eumeta japonica]|uniref:Uncharacterized protein n=1 Tax=Eumeta variegata TaxID=151549 RepID=A0A4C1YI78_EUMVA|nr:hypothetical protein EVAR_58960_1 [Eumeta japonica]